MKLIKYIFTLLVGATALSLTSCNDFLDRDPLGQFTEDDSPNALVGGKIFNVYYLMRSYDITAGIPAFMVHMVRSEDSEKGSDAGDGSNEAAMWDDFEYTASNGPLSAYWGQNYKIIYQCNEILDDIEKSGHKDDTEAEGQQYGISRRAPDRTVNIAGRGDRLDQHRVDRDAYQN